MFPRNHCEILSRIENGPYVVDQEFITGRDPLMLDYTVIATYLVENNKIQKVWFFAEEKK